MYIKYIAVICIFVSLQKSIYKYNCKLHICCAMLHNSIPNIIVKNVKWYIMSIYKDLNIRNIALKNNVYIVPIENQD